MIMLLFKPIIWNEGGVSYLMICRYKMVWKKNIGLNQIFLLYYCYVFTCFKMCKFECYEKRVIKFIMIKILFILLRKNSYKIYQKNSWIWWIFIVFMDVLAILVMV